MYILHTLQHQQKSGYDILREIKEVTGGTWVPSKGTLYPLLHQLEAEGLIIVASTESRERTAFALTPQGLETLKKIIARGGEHYKKLAHFRHLILAILGSGTCQVTGLLFEIKMLVEDMPPGKEKVVGEILEDCRDKLKKVI
ncbi:MAG: PadR family transcriptional regulator [Methanoregula sp.]|nr:PadR family transcriptional regulator [Methanoregula sp.]